MNAEGALEDVALAGTKAEVGDATDAPTDMTNPPNESEGVKGDEAYEEEERPKPVVEVDEYQKSQTLEEYLASKKKGTAKKEVR